jgi:hypothetical protein
MPLGLGERGLSAPVAAHFEVDTRCVFVKHSVHLDRSIETVSAALAAGPRKWLPRFDGTSHAEVGPQIAGLALRKKVAIEVGDPVTVGDSTEVPITWRATFIKRLFPVMTGKVELAPVDPHVTRLTVCGMYQPPLGRLGREVDEALMHRVAEATVKELAESIAKRLETLIPEATPEPV